MYKCVHLSDLGRGVLDFDFQFTILVPFSLDVHSFDTL